MVLPKDSETEKCADQDELNKGNKYPKVGKFSIQESTISLYEIGLNALIAGYDNVKPEYLRRETIRRAWN